MCILGEPTENKLVLAHFGSLWLRLSTHGPFVHTAFSEGRRGENSIVKMHPVLARGARVASFVGGGDVVRPRCVASRTSGRSRAASAGARRGRRTVRISSSTCACRPT